MESAGADGRIRDGCARVDAHRSVLCRARERRTASKLALIVVAPAPDLTVLGRRRVGRRNAACEALARGDLQELVATNHRDRLRALRERTIAELTRTVEAPAECIVRGRDAAG